MRDALSPVCGIFVIYIFNLDVRGRLFALHLNFFVEERFGRVFCEMVFCWMFWVVGMRRQIYANYLKYYNEVCNEFQDFFHQILLNSYLCSNVCVYVTSSAQLLFLSGCRNSGEVGGLPNCRHNEVGAQGQPKFGWHTLWAVPWSQCSM